MVNDHPLSPGGVTYALLDANVLLPPRLSDVLFDLCLEGLFSARWSADIEKEFMRNWPRVASGVMEAMPAQDVKAKRRLECYKAAIREHEIFGHETSSVLARVPAAVHAGDKHVAAAALVLLDYALPLNDKVYIVSSNLRDLAVADMKRLGIGVITPGEFIDSLTQADSPRVGLALDRCVDSLTNPPYTRARILEALRVHGASDTTRHFAQRWGVELP